jgi:hypothetical protein
MRLEELQRTTPSGYNAFMAMQFGDARLDRLVYDYFKPGIAASEFAFCRLRLGRRKSSCLPQTALQQVEVDRLGDELGGALFARDTSTHVVDISSHYHDWYVRPPALDVAEWCEPVHAGHVDIGQDHDQLRLGALRKRQPLGSLSARPRKLAGRTLARGDGRYARSMRSLNSANSSFWMIWTSTPTDLENAN